MFRRTLSGITDLWSIEAGRNVLRRLTTDPAREYEAIWSPAGDRIVFTSDRKGVLDLYETSLVGGSGSKETVLLETPEHKNPNDWSPDGRFILYSVQNPTTGFDLWVLPLFGEPNAHARRADGGCRAARTLLARRPMGAYESNESGTSEVYVQSFPDLAQQVRVSISGGAATDTNCSSARRAIS